MVLATLTSTSYQILLLLHIVSVIVAFAPAATHPLLEARFRKDEGPAGAQRFYGHAVKNTRAVYFPALIAAGLLGGAMIGASKTNDEVVWKLEQTWVWLGIVLWIALCGVVSGLIWPAEKKLAAGDESAASKLSAGGGIASILVIAQLYLMIFKPGF